MIVELVIVAAALAASVSGVVAARALRRRKKALPPALEPPEEEPKAEEPDHFAGLIARVGDVIQFGDDTRWPSAAILWRSDGEVVGATLLSREGTSDQCTVVFRAPDRHILWLERKELSLPPTPPSRLDVDGTLLDRISLRPLDLERVGNSAPDVGDSGNVAVYRGSMGDAALVITGRTLLAYHGSWVVEGDYDCLGQVPEEEEP